MVGGAMYPLPARLMSKLGLPASSLAMCRAATLLPKLCGVKLRLKSLLAPAAKVAAGVVTTANELPPVPSRLSPLMLSVVLPVLVMVKVLLCVLPTSTLPKLTVPNESVRVLPASVTLRLVVRVALRTAKAGKEAVLA